MRVYWDTSALLNAVVSRTVKERLKADSHCTRLHTFSEAFSTLTGRGITVRDAHGNPERLVMEPKQAAQWLRSISGHLDIVDLDADETLAGLDRAQTLGVQGGQVYDYIHRLAADKAKADILLTRNVQDFSVLSGTAKVQFP